MSCSDPIADMLTCIRNASKAGLPVTEMSHSRMKAEVARILKKEGYIADVAEGDDETLVLRIEAELFEELTLLDEESLENVVDELMATDVYEHDGSDPEDVLAFVTALSELAQLAESQGPALFVWIKLFQD